MNERASIAWGPLAVVGVIAMALGACSVVPPERISPGRSTAPTAAASGPAASEAPATRITVMLGIYSGRPDPSWDLTAAQVAQVDRAIAVLPFATGAPPTGGLGYHGFTLVIDRPGTATETLVAYRGAVAPPGVDARRYRIDAGRTVEKLLLDAGRPVLAAHEVAAVEADLAAGP